MIYEEKVKKDNDTDFMIEFNKILSLCNRDYHETKRLMDKMLHKHWKLMQNNLPTHMYLNKINNLIYNVLYWITKTESELIWGWRETSQQKQFWIKKLEELNKWIKSILLPSKNEEWK